MDAKHLVLKRYFGYDNFRVGQESIIDAMLEGNDALAIMPTGAGKSLCFQIPAMVFDGITLVVSPLVSLMKDQVMALVAAGVPAAFFNSSLTERQYEKAVENAKKGMYKIIYVAPERLLTQRFQSFVRQSEISMVAIDESHCVSQWGQDFRPSYLQVPKFIEGLKKRPVVSAFTATATKTVKNDIIKLLCLENPKVVTTGFDRSNLYFQVQKNRDKKGELLDIVKEHKGESGIVYCSTRKKVEEVCDILNEYGISATRYHAGLEQQERVQNQDDFLFDKKQIMVATNAFGMGIDKSDVRFVVHFNMPKDMESYYQEAGRAGRDGAEADCILLYSAQDVSTAKYLINNSRENDDIDEEKRKKLIDMDMERLESMIFYCVTKECLRNCILEYFGETPMQRCGNCFNCKAMEKKTIISRLKPQVNGELYEELRSLRKGIAGAMGVPAFVIFSDSTLKDMCRKMPRNTREFLDVSGVGHVKTEQYGKRFIEVIKKYTDG